ncbi:MAG TPA: hypothetical protein VNM43_06340 [Dehalococcoidia bacterium]|nr:hypothetical protein [Dehalococcoidia bacterium]
MQSFDYSLAQLQSGFVLAALVVAVLFAERLGGTAELAKRVYQVALGVALVLLTLSATTAFVRPPTAPEDLLEQGVFFGDSFETDVSEEEDEEARRLLRETAQNVSEVRTIHIGVAVVFVLAGLVLTARMTVLPLAGLLGGVLLLLVSGIQDGRPATAGDFFSAVFNVFLPSFESVQAGRTHDIVMFVVLLAGVAALGAFGYMRWERTATAPPQPEGTPL